MKHDNLNLGQRILLEILWGMSWLFAIMPYWFKYYVVQSFLYFVLYHCLHYRMKVVMENLRNSFPEKSEEELKIVARKFYITLAEMFVDTINLAHMPEKKIRRLVKVRNLEEHLAATEGKDWVALTAHYGCWEYCSFWVAYAVNQELVAVYHPLHNALMDALYRRLRDLPHVVTVPMRESMRYYIKHRDRGVEGRRLVMGLIADQNPPRRPDSYWFRFLNQDTIFFDGGEKLAMKYKLPVYFCHLKRVKRGCYEMSLELISDGKTKVKPNEITEKYVRTLERAIREQPEMWIWSHRRWKHKREDGKS